MQIFRIRNIIIDGFIFVKPANIVYSEEDKMCVISAGWRIVIADRKISIEYRVKKEKKDIKK
ncbi:hypothetical protein ES705_43099 [subsurface metagenome]